LVNLYLWLNFVLIFYYCWWTNWSIIYYYIPRGTALRILLIWRVRPTLIYYFYLWSMHIISRWVIWCYSMLTCLILLIVLLINLLIFTIQNTNFLNLLLLRVYRICSRIKHICNILWVKMWDDLSSEYILGFTINKTSRKRWNWSNLCRIFRLWWQIWNRSCCYGSNIFILWYLHYWKSLLIAIYVHVRFSVNIDILNSRVLVIYSTWRITSINLFNFCYICRRRCYNKIFISL